MISRRVLGLVLSASVLHLTMVGRDLGCSSHEESGAAVATDTAAASHHPASHKPDQREQETERPAPGLPPCCLMFASCVVAAARSAEGELRATPFGLAAKPAVVTTPKSRTFGPEPPPPKA